MQVHTVGGTWGGDNCTTQNIYTVWITALILFLQHRSYWKIVNLCIMYPDIKNYLSSMVVLQNMSPQSTLNWSTQKLPWVQKWVHYEKSSILQKIFRWIQLKAVRDKDKILGEIFCLNLSSLQFFNMASDFYMFQHWEFPKRKNDLSTTIKTK